jgi:hypothetical protein
MITIWMGMRSMWIPGGRRSVSGFRCLTGRVRFEKQLVEPVEVLQFYYN